MYCLEIPCLVSVGTEMPVREGLFDLKSKKNPTLVLQNTYFFFKTIVFKTI